MIPWGCRPQAAAAVDGVSGFPDFGVSSFRGFGILVDDAYQPCKDGIAAKPWLWYSLSVGRQSRSTNYSEVLMSVLLDKYFRAAVEKVRNELGNADVGGFHLTIKASGRTMTDRAEVKIVYTLGDSQWGSNTVEGDTLPNVLTEMLRRHGWNEAHAPLSLPAPVDANEDA